MKWLALISLVYMVSSSVFAASGKSSPLPHILTYQELARLSQPKRMKYLRDYADLLVLMESYRLKYEGADAREFANSRELLASLLKQFEILPQASADLEGLRDMRASEQPAKATATQPTEQRAKTVDALKQQGVDRAKVSSQSPSARPEEVDALKQKGADRAKALSQSPAMRPEEVDAKKDKGATKCTPPDPMECKDLNKTEFNAARKEYYKSSGAPKCIAGGFPTEYAGGKKKPGGCKLLRKLPFSNYQQSCPHPNEAFCNPILFCNIKVGSGGAEELSPLCAPSSGHNPPVTKACDAKYDELIASGTYKACDPFSINMEGLQEEWNKLRSATLEMARDWCRGDAQKEFQVVFCGECETLKKRMFAMADAATGKPCSPNDGAGAAADAPAVPAAPVAPATREEMIP